MSLDPSLFIHPSDKSAMQALVSIPGFSQLVKAYMKIWNERQFKIINMSSNLRLSSTQMNKYYDMLIPICEKLGIDIPELYMKLDVYPNAYTYGDTNPFIVMTSGLIETFPDELIPTVLAHECGHIVCRHTMYRTMGQLILQGTNLISGIASLVNIPIQIAFAYWMRCSEYSADRVSAIYDGSSDKVVEMCMRFSGADKDVDAEVNSAEFLSQADEYEEMTKDSKWDKTLEFLLFNQMDHPLNAVRAKECVEWVNSDQFRKVSDFLTLIRSGEKHQENAVFPVPDSSQGYLGRNYEEVREELFNFGFHKIKTKKVIEKGAFTRNGQAVGISINGDDHFAKGDWYPLDSEIVITFYEPATEEEIAAAHKGKIQIPDSSKKYLGRNYKEVRSELLDAGFKTVYVEPQDTKKNLFIKDSAISRITVAGQSQFDKGDWFAPEAIIRIGYYSFISEL